MSSVDLEATERRGFGVRLPPSVFFVKGAGRACLYDLRCDPINLYHLDSQATQALDQFLLAFTKQQFVPPEHQALIGDLRKMDLLTHGDGSLVSLPSFARLQSKIKPTTAWVEITQRCSLSCSHCYGTFHKQGSDLCVGHIETVLRNVFDCGFSNLQIIGGEPFLVPKILKQIIARSKELGIPSIEICTNGMHLNRDWISFLKEHCVSLAVSVHGASELPYKLLTGTPVGFSKHQKLFPELNAADVSYRACVVRQKYNQSESLAAIGTALQIPFSRLREDIVRLTGLATDSLLNSALKRKRYITKRSFERPIRRFEVLRNALGHGCFATKAYVSHNLDVFPCAMERGRCYGNLLESTLSDMLNNQLETRFFSKDFVQECKTCEFRYAYTDCRPDRNGLAFDAKPWYCTYDPLTGFWNQNEEEPR